MQTGKIANTRLAQSAESGTESVDACAQTVKQKIAVISHFIKMLILFEINCNYCFPFQELFL